MSQIDLPRPLEDYFAFAELERTNKGRRFSITLPYLDGSRLDRLQWWYHVGDVQERIIGEAGIAALREKAIERFRLHIERWLRNTGRRLYGDGPIPQLSPLEVSVENSVDADVELTASDILPWPADKVANG